MDELMERQTGGDVNVVICVADDVDRSAGPAITFVLDHVDRSRSNGSVCGPLLAFLDPSSRSRLPSNCVSMLRAVEHHPHRIGHQRHQRARSAHRRCR
jgi:hypothetical protein